MRVLVLALVAAGGYGEASFDVAPEEQPTPLVERVRVIVETDGSAVASNPPGIGCPNAVWGFAFVANTHVELH